MIIIITTLIHFELFLHREGIDLVPIRASITNPLMLLQCMFLVSKRTLIIIM